jgi:AcrR family transcriptional regulator
MPKTLTSKEEILEGAYRLAGTYGLASISIRGVAGACGVSSGTIYNYFTSRDELVAAVAAELFGKAFYEGFCHPRSDESYLRYCKRLYASLDERLSATGSDWLTQFQGLESGARQAGRRQMEQLLEHMRQGLQSVLVHDPSIDQDILVDELDPEHVSAFTLNGMFDALKRGEHECSTLLSILGRALR